MSKQKRLFERATESQLGALEEVRRTLRQAEVNARAISESEQFSDSYKSAEVEALSQSTRAVAARALREAQEAQESLETELQKSFAVEAPAEERTYNAARIGTALGNVRNVEELVELYGSEPIRRDAALRSELERAVELHPLGKHALWQETLRQARPEAVKAAEQWRGKLSAFTGLTGKITEEAVGSGFRQEKHAELEPILASFANERGKLLSRVE